MGVPSASDTGCKVRPVEDTINDSSGVLWAQTHDFSLTNDLWKFRLGLKIASSKYKSRTCLVSIENAICFSNSAEKRKNYAADLLTLLSQAQIHLKWKKSEILHHYIKFLEHALRTGKLYVDSNMTKSLYGAHAPETEPQLRSFFRSANVYRNSVRNSATVAPPLYKLQKELIEKKDGTQTINFVRWRCGKRISATSRHFGCTTHSSAISHWCFNRKIMLFLFQEEKEGHRGPIGFWSRELNAALRNYSATGKEWLANV